METKTSTKISQEYSDDEIIDQVKKGNINYYSFIVRRYNQRLYRIAVSYKIPDDDCEDILQQTYIHAYQQLHQFKGLSKFSTWLIRILINECLMYKRKRKNNKYDYNFNEKAVTSTFINHQTPEEDFMKKQYKNILEEAIAKLPENYATIYTMVKIEGMSLKEASEILDISETNAKVRLFRAKNLITKYLTDNFSSEDIFTFGNERCDRVLENVMRNIIS